MNVDYMANVDLLVMTNDHEDKSGVDELKAKFQLILDKLSEDEIETLGDVVDRAYNVGMMDQFDNTIDDE